MARVRRARREDFPAMMEMGRKFTDTDDYRGVIAFVPEQINNLLEQLVAHPHGLLLVSEDDGVVTGMFGAVAFPHPISGEITVGELFWWADRRGVGLRLLRAAELWAETRGAQIMQMIAPNARVGQLYQRLGYRQAETLFQRRF
jgi:GNAT superfamily N-acetyltransferase